MQIFKKTEIEIIKDILSNQNINKREEVNKKKIEKIKKEIIELNSLIITDSEKLNNLDKEIAYSRKLLCVAKARLEVLEEVELELKNTREKLSSTEIIIQNKTTEITQKKY